MLTNFALLEGELEEEGSRGPGVKFPYLRPPRLPDPACTAGFASTSCSYKAWIGSEEAKQTTEASSQTANPVSG